MICEFLLCLILRISLGSTTDWLIANNPVICNTFFFSSFSTYERLKAKLLFHFVIQLALLDANFFLKIRHPLRSLI